jgi:pimeloyl-ACP methyl ester carboxylesterase
MPNGAAIRFAEPVHIAVGGLMLTGDLTVPPQARGLAIFAHGSGSSRFSSRNRFVADVLDHRRLATLLVDLLTDDEEALDRRIGHLRFDIDMLADRLVTIAAWTQERPELRGLPLGLFGASTGGGAALVAAARQPSAFRAVVSRGGRPDLARDALPRVGAPTLLIVGSRDDFVLELNQDALRRLNAPARLEVIPDATHLFEEPGALEQVANLAAGWFEQNFH